MGPGVAAGADVVTVPGVGCGVGVGVGVGAGAGVSSEISSSPPESGVLEHGERVIVFVSRFTAFKRLVRIRPSTVDDAHRAARAGRG